MLQSLLELLEAPSDLLETLVDLIEAPEEPCFEAIEVIFGDEVQLPNVIFLTVAARGVDAGAEHRLLPLAHDERVRGVLVVVAEEVE